MYVCMYGIWFVLQVAKGLTHIKYNKYAPSAEEAAGMTSEQFRTVIYQRMRQAEEERRRQGKVGGAVSDDYIASLSGRGAATETEKAETSDN